MTSFLLIAKNQKLSLQYAESFCDSRSIDEFDRIYIDREALSDDTNKPLKQSIGIEDIKKMQQKLLLKPFKSKEKVIIIKEGELLTTPAQNALLKLLEEPPKNTYILLLSKQLDRILGTIQSRCQIILLDVKNIYPTTETQDVIIIVTQLATASVGELFLLAETHAKKKEDFLLWCEQIMTGTQKLLQTDVSEGKDISFYKRILTISQQAYLHAQTTNVSPRLLCEHMLLAISEKDSSS